MSYEPQILINKASIDAKSEQIEKEYYDKYVPASDDDQQYNYDIFAIGEVFRALHKVNTIKFPQLELIIVDVELTSRNQAFREKLDELEIEYQTHW